MKNESYCLGNDLNILGECPIWDPAAQTLYWIDIEQPFLYAFCITTQEFAFYEEPSPFTSIVFCQNNDLLATSKDGLFLLKRPHFTPKLLERYDFGDLLITFNDGKCDAAGRFWVGTRDLLHNRPVASLLSYSAQKGFKTNIESLIVSNGLDFSPDGKKIYFTETIAKNIYCCDFELESGRLSNRQLFAKISGENAYPDGLTVDAEGGVWSALWGEGSIVRYTPDGHIDQHIHVSAKNVTSCCFGGKDLNTLFITSSSKNFGADTDLGKNAGSVFAVETAFTGKKSFAFSGYVD